MPNHDGLRRRLSAVASSLTIALLIAFPSAVSAAPITVDCDHAALQPAINAAPPDATIKVAGTCSGTFYINQNLTITGSPSATLNGGGAGSTLTINGFHAVRLAHLVITGGVAADGGGIHFQYGGSLTLDHVRVSGNTAQGGTQPGYARGGGIYVADPAFVTITNSTISSNHASESGSAAQNAQGGGVYVRGQLTLTNTHVVSNTASASSTTNAGDGAGGGVFIAGSLVVSGSVIRGNHASGTGPQFGTAQGGGIAWTQVTNDALRLTKSTVSSNLAKATTPGDALAYGGGLYIYSAYSSPASITDSTLDGNRAVANSSGATATVQGGAIMADAHYSDAVVTVTRTKVTNSVATGIGATTATGFGGGLMVAGTTTLDHATLSTNELHIHAGSGNATGGGGGARFYATAKSVVLATTIGGNVATAKSDSSAAGIMGGGLLTAGGSPVVLRLSTFSGNSVTSTANNASSEADGGGIALAGSNTNPGDTLTNSTVANNRATANGTTGPVAAGGGIAVYDKHLHMTFATIARNSATSTGSSPFAGGGGLYFDTGTSNLLFANVIALNTAVTGPDCDGSATSDGDNLFTDRTNCTLNTVVGDRVTAAPKLGTLAANGGPTKTIALMAGSPALDQVPAQACHTAVTTDQRGVARPQGTKCDEGAFERRS
jgi:hypothetical protein